MLVVDTCIDEDELAHLRDALQQTLNLLPEDALVGLITFGTLVHVHEIGFSDCSKSYVFRGEREYSTAKVQEMLGIAPAMSRTGPASAGNQMAGRQPALGRFLMPVGDCTFALEQILEDLQKDPWPCQPDEVLWEYNTYNPHCLYRYICCSCTNRDAIPQRVQRCTGTALSVAIGLLESAVPVPKQGSRLMLFIAGPPTVGSGNIVGRFVFQRHRIAPLRVDPC